MALPVLGQPNAPASRGTDAKPFAYEVVTIKPDNSGNAYWRFTPDGFSTGGMGAANLIRAAFNVLMDDQIVGLPAWARTEPLAIQAKMDADTVAALARLSPADRSKQMQLMMQPILADRFALKFHHENKELPIYELRVANGGVKLAKSSPDGGGRGTYSSGKIDAQGVSMENLAANLSFIAGRMVRDKTELTGTYDLTLEYAPEGADSSDPRPSLFTALEEQLGLKLVPARGQVDVIVVDHVERPSEN
jgi:uncharacterized protein (TIGR03435 family)